MRSMASCTLALQRTYEEVTMSPKLQLTVKDAGVRLGVAPRTAGSRVKNAARKAGRSYERASADLKLPMPDSASEIPLILTVKEAALWMGVHPKTIRRWIRAKVLKARRIERIIRIRRVDIEALFNVY